MKKFDKIYKAKMEEANRINEEKVLNDYKKIYECLLRECEVVSTKNMSPEEYSSFESILNTLWTKESGLTESGEVFLHDKNMFLTEKATKNQKTNFLSKKIGYAIKESLSESDIKMKIYTSIDEMLKQIKANDLNESKLNYKDLEDIITKEVNKHVRGYFEPMLEELNESIK